MLNGKFRVALRISLAALIASAFAGDAFAAPKSCDVRAFGAKGDGTTKDTAAVQKAIDACAGTSGEVTVGAGTYVIAPIVLKSKMTLTLAAGATLLGSPDMADYPHRTEMKQPTVQALLSTENASDVTLRGSGTIDGNGEKWWAMARTVKDAGVLGNPHPRPMLLLLDHSKHVVVEGITVQNSAFWQIVPYYSDDLVFRNLKVLAPQHAPNTDAIDPFASSHIVIDHVYADVGDDNIAIKSGPINSPGPDSPSHDITITDCEFVHGHGLSIGSELAGGANNIHGERIHFRGTDQGIRVKSNRDRGAQVYNLSFKDITMEDVKTPILISEYYPKTVPEGEVAAAPIGRLTPFFHDFVLENITATGATNAGYVVGLPESPVKGVVLRNVRIAAKKGMIVMYAQVAAHGLVIQSEDGKPTAVAANATLTMEK